MAVEFTLSGSSVSGRHGVVKLKLEETARFDLGRVGVGPPALDPESTSFRNGRNGAGRPRTNADSRATTEAGFRHCARCLPAFGLRRIERSCAPVRSMPSAPVCPTPGSPCRPPPSGDIQHERPCS